MFKKLITKITNSFQELRDISYLLIDSNTALISSSEVLRIDTSNNQFKNPLNLTSYGVGELIQHAINTFKVNKIYLALGGTNTVDGGVGMLQALGVDFISSSNTILKPQRGNRFCGRDLSNIKGMDFKNVHFLDAVSFVTLNDADISVDEMNIPNNQKISDHYEKDRHLILKGLESNISNFIETSSKYSQKKINMTEPFFGVAGGINIGLSAVTNPEFLLGADFFFSIFKIRERIKDCDLLITGEGRLDNSLAGKGPMRLSKIAKDLKKPVIYLTGDISDDFVDNFSSATSLNPSVELRNNGVSTIITCHFRNNFHNKNYREEELRENLRVNTRIVFEEELSKFFLGVDK